MILAADRKDPDQTAWAFTVHTYSEGIVFTWHGSYNNLIIDVYKVIAQSDN